MKILKVVALGDRPFIEIALKRPIIACCASNGISHILQLPPGDIVVASRIEGALRELKDADMFFLEGTYAKGFGAERFNAITGPYKVIMGPYHPQGFSSEDFLLVTATASGAMVYTRVREVLLRYLAAHPVQP